MYCRKLKDITWIIPTVFSSSICHPPTGLSVWWTNLNFVSELLRTPSSLLSPGARLYHSALSHFPILACTQTDPRYSACSLWHLFTNSKTSISQSLVKVVTSKPWFQIFTVILITYFQNDTAMAIKKKRNEWPEDMCVISLDAQFRFLFPWVKI